MKKLLCAFLALIVVLTLPAFGTSGDLYAGNPEYFAISVETMATANEFKDKLMKIAGQSSYTKMDVELSLLYAEAWGTIMNIAFVEMDAVSKDAPTGEYILADFSDNIDRLRLMYDAGLTTGDEVIKGLADALKDNG